MSDEHEHFPSGRMPDAVSDGSTVCLDFQWRVSVLEHSSGGRGVGLELRESDEGHHWEFGVGPDEARHLARMLNAAADRAEEGHDLPFDE